MPLTAWVIFLTSVSVWQAGGLTQKARSQIKQANDMSRLAFGSKGNEAWNKWRLLFMLSSDVTKKNERGGIRNEKLRKRIRTAQTAQSSSDLMRVVSDKSSSVFHTVKKAIKSKKNVLPIFHGCDWKRPRWHVECLICIEDESRMQLSSLSDWLSELSCSDYCGFKKALLPR